MRPIALAFAGGTVFGLGLAAAAFTLAAHHMPDVLRREHRRARHRER